MDSTNPLHTFDEATKSFQEALIGFKEMKDSLRARLESQKRIDATRSLIVGMRDKDFMKSMAEICRTALNTPVAFVTLLDNETQYMLASAGLPPIECPVEDSLCQYVVGSKMTIEVMHLQEHEELAGAAFGIPEYDSYLGAPWKYDGEVLGSVCVLGPNETWTAKDVEVVETCANEITRLLSKI